MNRTVDSPLQHPTDSELGKWLDECFSKRDDDSTRVLKFVRTESPYQSSCRVETISITCADEKEFRLVFKNLSPTSWLKTAKDIRPKFYYHPQREIQVYRKVLSNIESGTPKYYGSLSSELPERYWLLLEQIDGEMLSNAGERSVWCAVCRWLAQFHSHFAYYPLSMQTAPLVLDYNEAFYLRWLDRATECLKSPRTRFTHRSQSDVNELIDYFKSLVPTLCRLPKTFIHGEFYPSNVLIQQLPGSTRISPIDWETAAIGPGLIDLAALTSGDWTDVEQKELVDSYYNSLRESELKPERDVFERHLKSCRLTLALRWLGWSASWHPPEEHRQDWFAEAMQLIDE